mgnify:CR=1 FL=1
MKNILLLLALFFLHGTQAQLDVAQPFLPLIVQAMGDAELLERAGEALGEVSAAALTQPLVPKTPPLVTEAGLFSLTLDDLLPIEVVVIMPTVAVALTIGSQDDQARRLRAPYGLGRVADAKMDVADDAVFRRSAPAALACRRRRGHECLAAPVTV